MRKWVSRSIDIVLGLLIAFVLFCQISIQVTSPKNYGVPSIFGTSFLYVATDSMEGELNDSLPTGTGIIIKKTAPEDINIGDVITFYYPKLNAPDTHRVVDIDVKEDGKRVFKTRGDNLFAWSCPASGCPETAWESIDEKYLIGKVVAHNDAFGDFLTIVSPQAAASSGKSAWFLPVAVIVPLMAFAFLTGGEAIYKYRKTLKEDRLAIEKGMKEAGIDPNDEKQALLFEEKYYYKKEVREQIELVKEEERRKFEKQLKRERRKAHEHQKIK